VTECFPAFDINVRKSILMWTAKKSEELRIPSATVFGTLQVTGFSLCETTSTFGENIPSNVPGGVAVPVQEEDISHIRTRKMGRRRMFRWFGGYRKPSFGPDRVCIKTDPAAEIHGRGCDGIQHGPIGISNATVLGRSIAKTDEIRMGDGATYQKILAGNTMVYIFHSLFSGFWNRGSVHDLSVRRWSLPLVIS